MTIKFDTYSFKARTLPACIALAPIALLLVAAAPEALKSLTGVTASLVLASVLFFLGQIGMDYGKRLEERLWRSWGGPPTTRYLRHSNHEFNEVTRGRIHAKLSRLGLYVPTREEQEQDPRTADTRYQSCAEDLIRRTRDTRKFPLVCKALTEYGFRRNLLGLKVFGMFLTIVEIAGSAWCAYSAWTATNELLTFSLGTGLIGTGLLIVWLVWVTERTVKLSADRYARFLLEAALEQE